MVFKYLGEKLELKDNDNTKTAILKGFAEGMLTKALVIGSVMTIISIVKPLFKGKDVG